MNLEGLFVNAIGAMMPKISVALGMTLLVVGNIFAVFSDALIKDLPAETALYQFILFRQLTAVAMLLPLSLINKKQKLFNEIKWHFVRSHIWLIGVVFMVISLQSLPLATANAIFYAAPLLMLPISFLLYKDNLSPSTIIVSILGFIGILIIVQPKQINIGAIFALLVAATIAINNLLVRKLPQNHTVYQTLLLTNLVGTPTALVLALWENSPFSWESLTIAALSNVFILIYAGICVEVYKNIEAHKVSSAEYSGLLVAVIVGIIWFNEVPNLSLLVGGTLIVAPLIWLANAERVKYRNLN